MVRVAQFATLQPEMVSVMWTPAVYAYHSREALHRIQKDKEVVRNSALSDHVVGCVMAFVDKCQHACVLSRGDGCPAYNIP